MPNKKPERRFTAKEITIYRDLRNVMSKMNATSLKVDYDLLGNEPAVRIYFDRYGKRYVSRCESYEEFLDNLRAAQLAIEYTYRIAESYSVDFTEEKGVHQNAFDLIFTALEAPLDPNVLLLGNGDEWWDVLGISRNATKAEIVNAYKSLAKIHHPDVGGAKEDFIRLRHAYERAIAD
jgi:hypothetical protein